MSLQLSYYHCDVGLSVVTVVTSNGELCSEQITSIILANFLLALFNTDLFLITSCSKQPLICELNALSQIVAIGASTVKTFYVIILFY